MSERLSDDERRQLLSLARGAIAARLGRPAPELPAASAALREKRGAFVTLRGRQDGELRGCVGFSEARFPLHEAVERAALLAAFEDGRFDPVRSAELDGLVLEVSILSPLRPIAAEGVEVGRDGLVIRYAGHTGLLLPLVPVQFGWDREEFLQHLCLKAGLPRDSWNKPGAELLAFTTELLEEVESPPA